MGVFRGPLFRDSAIPEVWVFTIPGLPIQDMHRVGVSIKHFQWSLETQSHGGSGPQVVRTPVCLHPSSYATADYKLERAVVMGVVGQLEFNLRYPNPSNGEST